mmetsp:Transcript_9594/g.14496  ORF Transcript_9594/g.14496 Transcript_9594/m.14496 type:complete len:594 (+) Transcript_9594:108-1889(+)|eukprot:CAMPEP_0196232038 /NCGR_PEP_ID=MMETSP0913-20130531/2718_1 /TAXON_ID=49265 /ORGANISM="Thalassiosira rotula, Strain GSO102" /LENGTH=593 /DNA_ID=CAMNT_0041512379 /DNA_START=52 /DNA_END=1833 /DNA_ORIENTATION=+
MRQPLSFTIAFLLLTCSVPVTVNSFLSPTTRTRVPIRAKIRYRTSSSQLRATNNSNTLEDSYDVLIVGSGIGGLSSAALLSRYGYSVAVLESHYAPGGAAHGYSVHNKEVNDGEGGTFTFDTGPSFFSGLNSNYPPKASNPLRTLLDLCDETVECIPYTTFGLKFPEGDFVHSPKFGLRDGVVDEVAGSGGVGQWRELMKRMEPLAKAVDAMPTLALRGDAGVALTAGMFLPNFAGLNPLENLKLTKPFSNIIKSAGVDNGFVRNWLDVLCFCLSGVPSDGTITAEMAMMMGEFYDEDAIMDCPVGGAKSIVDALVRGIEKNGGQVILKSHVDEICIEEGQAVGVRLKKSPDRIIRANKGVISNLSVWDLMNSGIVDTNQFPESFVKERKETPACPSFMHIHVGFQMSEEELSKLQAHYIYMDDWDRSVTEEDNCALISIPSVHDATLAPTNHGVLHIYTPATERFDRWENVKRNTPEYNQLKEERSEYLWGVLEKVIPDIRERTVHYQVGTPLTHQRFLNRHRGTYGPAIYAGEASFPFPNTPIKNLLVCGDSCFPGIGVPAVSGSGMIAANSVSFDSIGEQMSILQKLKAE